MCVGRLGAVLLLCVHEWAHRCTDKLTRVRVMEDSRDTLQESLASP